MWEEPIVHQRVKSALDDGITSQTAACVKRDHMSRLSRLRKLIRRLFARENKSVEATQRGWRYRHS